MEGASITTRSKSVEYFFAEHFSAIMPTFWFVVMLRVCTTYLQSSPSSLTLSIFHLHARCERLLHTNTTLYSFQTYW